MLCHRHLPHQLVYRGSRDRKEPEAAAGEQYHHTSRLFALRANHHHQVKMVCKNAGTPRGGGPAMESLGTGARRGLRALRSFSDSARTEARRGLEGGYEPCAPFLTRQERRLEGGYEPCAPFLTRQERGLEEGWKGARWAHPERGKAL